MFNSKIIISALVIVSFVFGSAVLAVDPYYSKQWYLQKIKAEEVWNVTKGNSSLVVAVIDTGVDINHPDIQGNIWTNTREIPGDGIDNDSNGFIDDANGWNFVKSTASPAPNLNGVFSVDPVSHGTFIAGLISAIHDNNTGIKGVTSLVKIMPIAALDAMGYGNSSTVSQAIDYAVANGASIINLSFGGYEYSETLKASINNAYNRGVLIVAAAGNAENNDADGKDLTNDPLYPICYDKETTENKILGVIASDENNKVTRFTNYGKGCIDLAAPGINMVSLLYQDDNRPQFKNYIGEGWQGSSFAAALVSGAAALLKSANPVLDAKQMIKILIQQSGLLFVDQVKHQGKVGEGVLNIKRAIDSIVVVKPTPAIAVSPVNAAPLTPAVYNTQILAAPKNEKSAVIRIFNSQGKQSNEIKILEGEKFKGINFQLVDVDKDGNKDIVAGATLGSQPFVRILNFSDKIISSFLAFDKNFKGGVNVSAGDVDADGNVEIVAVPQNNYEPEVKIFDLNGKLKKQFYAFDKNYKKGLNVEVGDLDKDGKAEIVIAPHQGMMPKLKIFDSQGQLKKSLVVYQAKFMGGVNIDLADVNKDGKLDIITGAGQGGGPHVQSFNYQGERLFSFLAYEENFKGGVEVKGIDWNADGKIDIIAAPSSGGGPHVKVFNQAGALLKEFFAWENNFTGGISIDAR